MIFDLNKFILLMFYKYGGFWCEFWQVDQIPVQIQYYLLVLCILSDSYDLCMFY